MRMIGELATLVRDMRTAQKRYFRTRAYKDLFAAKELEAAVDREVAQRLELEEGLFRGIDDGDVLLENSHGGGQGSQP